jgi:hypothetical protein
MAAIGAREMVTVGTKEVEVTQLALQFPAYYIYTGANGEQVACQYASA